MDMEEYEKTRATIKLMSELASGERSGEEDGWVDVNTVERMLEIKNG